MKRAIFSTYGGPEVLSIQDFKLPPVKDGQILIEQMATSINPVDIKVRRGDLRFLTGKKFPKATGSDFCGRVVQSKNNKFKEGDIVYGVLNTLKGGACSQEIITDGTNCSLKPVNLNAYEAAVTPVVGLTSYTALISQGNIQKNSRIFINGCTGGVGHFAVIMAKAIGAEVSGTCSEKNFPFATSIGVDHILDYNRPVPTGILRSFDFVFDTTGKVNVSDMYRIGNKDAKYSTTGFKPSFLLKSILSDSFNFIKLKTTTELLNSLKNFIEKHNIKPFISREWSLDEIQDAHKDFESGLNTGKILIRIK